MAATPLTDQIATRERTLNFFALGMMLPNPDPILRAQGRSIQVYRNMRTDALVGGCIRRRKSAVRALEWGLDRGGARSRVAKAVEAVLRALPLERIIGEMLDATLYGYQPMEVLWAERGGLWVPAEVLGKPPEWFCYDTENRLRFRSREAPLDGELVQERKFLVPRQDPSYENPYGFADLSMCFWPLTFKKGGLRFWLAFAEKFGSAWPVGKLPRSASTDEKKQLLDSLEALIQDGVAVIPDDGSIDLKEAAGKAATADLYERLVMHCRGEISIALLGQNQTTEADANRASATAGLEVTRDIRDADAGMVAEAVNELIGWVCDFNFPGAERPVFSLWDQESQDQLQADRDKSNYDAGARFTNAYWARAYGYQEGDLAEPGAGAPPVTGLAGLAGVAGKAAPGAAFAESGARPDPTAAATDALMTASAPQWERMASAAADLVRHAETTAQAQTAIAQAYGWMDSERLTQLMTAAFALAELQGMADVQAETQAESGNA